MPIPLIIPIMAALGLGHYRNKVGEERQAQRDAYKEKRKSDEAFMKIIDEISAGKRGEADVAAIKNLEPHIRELPGGDRIFDSVHQNATAGHMQQQAMKAIVAQLMGGEMPGAPPSGGPAAQVPGAPQAPAAPQPMTPPNAAAAMLPSPVTMPPSAPSPQGYQMPSDSSGWAPQPPMIDHQATAAAMPLPKAVGTTSAGRVLYQDPRTGEHYSEKSITIEDERINGGKPTNIPTVYGGRQLADEDAIKRIVDAGGKDPETGRALEGFGSVEEAVTAAKSRSHDLGMTMQRTDGDKTFPKLPGIMKLPAATTMTIPKEVFGIEIHGSKAEALQSVIGQARQRGFDNGEIHDNLVAQGINPPESLTHNAFNEFAGKFLTGDEFMKNPRKALQEIVARFPNTDPKHITSFGQQAFQAAYIGAKQRLRAAGVHISDRSLAQAAFNEATSSVGSEFVPDTVLQDVDRSKASTTDNLMVELLDKGLAGDPKALQQYGTMLDFHAKKIGIEEATRRIAGIRAEQATAYIPPDNLKDMEKNGQPMPFGTTQAQAAGQQATIVKPEVQASRTIQSSETTKMQFAAKRAIPLFESVSVRMTDLLDKAAASGFAGKAAGAMGFPSALGQEIKGFDEFKGKFAGNLRALAGETAGVITEGDIQRIMKIFPDGKDFVTLMVDRREQIVKSLSEVQAILSDRLGQKVEPFAGLITKIQSHGASQDKFGDTLAEFDKALQGKK